MFMALVHHEPPTHFAAGYVFHAGTTAFHMPYTVQKTLGFPVRIRVRITILTYARHGLVPRGDLAVPVA